MKRKFSTAWKSSKQPRKQRKYAANAPIHIKRKMLGANLSKELRKKHGKRSIPIRKGDTVVVMRGKFKKKKGKVSMVLTKMAKIYVEGIQVKKKDGSTVNVPVRNSNLQIVELNLDDSRRLGGKKEIQKKKIASPKGEEKGKDNKEKKGAKVDDKKLKQKPKEKNNEK